MKRMRKRRTPYEEALAKPKSRALAIRAKCWDCEGGDGDPGWQKRVRTCVVEKCPLWHVRPYRRPRVEKDELAPQNAVYRGSGDLRSEFGGGGEPAGVGR